MVGEKKRDFSDVKIKTSSPGKISEFFHHLIAYGGFNIKDGVMFVWVDPCFFVPIRAFSLLHNDLRKELGDNEADDLFYWLGRLNGMAGTVVLINKFGFNSRDLAKIMNSVTQDGFGYLTLKRFEGKGDKLSGEIEGKNSTHALQYKELFGIQKAPVDQYIMGVMAGGSEILFDTGVKAREEKCMAKGDEFCQYNLYSTEKSGPFNFFSGTNLDEAKIFQSIKKLSMGRKVSFKPFGRKNIKFGDGRFILRGNVGINISSYSLIILHKILIQKLKKRAE